MKSLIQAVMERIEGELGRCFWNKHQEQMDSPFSNTGNQYQNDTFVVRAYNWDENVEPNFECDGLKVWWYKHVGRGLYFEYDCGDLTIDKLSDILEKCLDAIRRDFKDDEDDYEDN